MKPQPRLLPQLKRNVGTIERMLSIALGSYLLYSATKGKYKAIKTISGTALLFRGATANCPMYDVLNITTASSPSPIDITAVLTVNKPKDEVYEYWRKLDNLPSFMKHLESVTVIDEKRSEWKVRIPGGLGTIDWESEITKDVRGETIEWKSIEHSMIENSGSVTFKDAGKYGTEVRVEILYRAPAGYIGKGIGELLSPLTESMIKEDIRNFRRIIETGELATIEGQASGKN